VSLLHFVGSEVLDVVVPSHRAVKALWIETSNSLIDAVRPCRQSKLVVRLNSAILRSTKDSEFPVVSREFRFSIDNCGGPGFGSFRCCRRCALRLNRGTCLFSG